MRSQCVIPCFWKNQYWDLGAIYTGTDATPKSKKGVEYFVSLDTPKPVEAATEVVGPEKPARRDLQKMPNIELQVILQKKYGITVDEKVKRMELINMVLQEQEKRPVSNQDIANTAKG